jgi:peptide chain release factor 3
MGEHVDVAAEAARRRTFAIISHPDAGKTTLTEKFLLYAGAIVEAGAVRSRKAAREATSDWMELERQRGISVTSAAVRFGHEGRVMNLLDTPGHRDFSEDTYRVLSAVDAAVMVLDAARGVEAQTRKLFEVCRRRGTPIVTFVNKLDRPSPDPLAVLDDIEEEIGRIGTPVTWPVTTDGHFEGVVDRRDGTFHRFTSSVHGSTRAGEEIVPFDPDEHDPGRAAREGLGLLDSLGLEHDQELFLAGETSPVFFGSALNNFGVRLLLDALVDLAPAPLPRRTVDGDEHPITAPFSGFVFKVQANMDPNHRDRIAFVRVCSGRFERGMSATCARTERPFSMRYAHQVFGQERTTLDEAFPGDIVGLVNATELRIGDTLHEDGEGVAFPPPPTFAPEHFRIARPADRSRVKQFRRALDELDEEGAIQVLRHPERGDQAPVLAAVGELQFDVAAWRFEHEFGAPVRLEPSRFSLARRTDGDGERVLRGRREAEIHHRADGTPLALFSSRYQLERVEREHPDLTLDTIVTL